MAIIGNIPGSIGEVSTLMILIGGAIILFGRVAPGASSPACMLGMVASACCSTPSVRTPTRMFAMPWYWHLVLGGFAFGMIFMATDRFRLLHHKGNWLV
ncbi:RnfABCDGE type electron transport complex subunit D, partial [Serratia ureilytica]|nr:RnfABCDGE type electron transport complex subunit D [Serratia ureilytica]